MSIQTPNAIFAALLIALAPLACDDDSGDEPSGDSQGLQPAPGSPLSAAERDSLLYMREEEKLARDVYVALQGQARVFDNIIQSEERHMAAIQTLLGRYSLPDPTLGHAAGEFENADLAQLYGELVLAGSASPIASLQVGVQIEELDISDLQAALAQPLHLDIRTVYENLALASANHLTAFYSVLVAAGGSYEPQYLTPAEFEAVLSGDWRPD